MNNYDNYFKNRLVDNFFYENYQLPPWLVAILPIDKNSFILDFGCGLGQTMLALKKLGYKNIFGVDIAGEAIDLGLTNNLQIETINNLLDYANSIKRKYDFVIMSHVLEHLEKAEVISSLSDIKNKILKPGGSLYIATPNAQSPVGCYWAYEDFTHNTIFTSGSLSYVLRSAGFQDVQFLDPLNIENKTVFKKYLSIFLQKVYLCNILFWNKVVGASYHKKSPKIFSWEIKVLAK